MLIAPLHTDIFRDTPLFGEETRNLNWSKERGKVKSASSQVNERLACLLLTQNGPCLQSAQRCLA